MCMMAGTLPRTMSLLWFSPQSRDNDRAHAKPRRPPCERNESRVMLYYAGFLHAGRRYRKDYRVLKHRGGEEGAKNPPNSNPFQHPAWLNEPINQRNVWTIAKLFCTASI